jgi:hypothetical protein
MKKYIALNRFDQKHKIIWRVQYRTFWGRVRNPDPHEENTKPRLLNIFSENRKFEHN